MAITQVGVTQIAGAAVGSLLTLGVPVGIQDGDLYLAFVRAQGTMSGSTPITMPAGWSRLGSNGSGDRAQGIFYKPIPSAAAESGIVTHQFSGWTTGRAVGALIALRGVDLNNIVGGGIGYVVGDTLSAYTATATPASVFALWGDERTSPNSHVPTTPPAGYTSITNVQNTQDASTTGSRTAIWAGRLDLAEGGSANIAAATLIWSAPSAERANSIVLRGIPAPHPTGVPVKDGTGATAWLSYLDGAGVRKAPTRVGIWIPGFTTVTAAIAKAGFTMAHRGGSDNWPEMSEYAYDRSVMRGYGILEFSTQRSSDGWWFGLHDNDFNRTSQTTGTPAPATLTQAQILSTYQNSLNSNGLPKPYYGLINFLDKYTPTHVVFVDIKNQLGFQTEFLNLLDAHGGPSKIVVKYAGATTGGMALADAAKARGYTTWGYFYEADIASVGTYQSHYDMLGMEFGASTGTWTTMLGFGKKVIAHVVGTQAGYATSITKGAAGVQVSGVNVVTPVSAWN